MYKDTYVVLCDVSMPEFLTTSWKLKFKAKFLGVVRMARCRRCQSLGSQCHICSLSLVNKRLKDHEPAPYI